MVEESTQAVPFLPTLRWMALWLQRQAEGYDYRQAVEKANETASTSKEMARTMICSPEGERLMLTVPVVGGSKRLRSGKVFLNTVPLSDHGNWRHNHLGAFEACYGRAPYYSHLIPELINIYQKEIFSLQEFNFAILKALSSFIMQDISVGDLKDIFNSTLIKRRGGELAPLTDPEISVIDPLMKFGKETLPVFAAIR